MDVDARKWWNEREAKSEKEMSAALHKRMEAQRAQIHAFKLEQSKWEHELQLRISKYAHDRKLLSEHNIELQDALTLMEEKYAVLQSEMDQQSALIIELEGQLSDMRNREECEGTLRSENESLRSRLTRWESLYESSIATALQQHENQQHELVDLLQSRLEEALKASESCNTPRRRCLHDHSQAPNDGRSSLIGCEVESEEGVVFRELEKICKQKDQTIMSLKGMLDRHESISDERLRLMQAKYDQVKAVNIALQKKLLVSLSDQSDEKSSVLP